MDAALLSSISYRIAPGGDALQLSQDLLVYLWKSTLSGTIMLSNITWRDSGLLYIVGHQLMEQPQPGSVHCMYPGMRRPFLMTSVLSGGDGLPLMSVGTVWLSRLDYHLA